MQRRALLAGAGSLASASLAGCFGDLLLDPVTETRSDSFDVTDETVLSVSNRNGDVTVQQTDDDRLTYSADVRASSESGLDSIAIEVVTGDRFVVQVDFEGGSAFENRSVDLTVDVPAGVTVQSATSANGDVVVEDVAGHLDAVTSNGDVEVTGVQGIVNAESANGDVTVEDTMSLSLARTTNGEVDAELLEIHGDVTCTSENGDVTVRVGDEVAAGIVLRTNNGEATVEDLEYTADTERRRRIEGQLRGKLEPVLTLRSSNGDVTLRPA
ncbi:DUF4097 family beta strand repeat-containing protein [Halobacteriales archaeon Cl-PHB]